MATRRDLFEIEAQVPRGTLVYLSPDRIEPNPRQPRQQINRSRLDELKTSIAARGILQALLGVRGENGRVILIAGHRRWQAARELGLSRVPIILIDTREGSADPLVDAIIENVQRENLAPWEEGESYRQLAAEFSWDHKQIAATIGKSRSYVTQRIRAAENLSPIIKEFFLTGDARVLLNYNSFAKDFSPSLEKEVTAVTPNYKFHNLTDPEGESNLASFLNNIELVRRLTALSPESQVLALRDWVRKMGEGEGTLSIADLTHTLKDYRDLTPSPKARLKKPNSNSGFYSQLSFDFPDLEVIRWSEKEGGFKQENKTAQNWGAEDIDRLIARYEGDLARLRNWREKIKGDRVQP